MGKKGRKNCLVIGNTSDVSSKVTRIAVWYVTAGSVMMARAKMSRTVTMRYCPSKKDHWCERSDRRVSEGEKEVCRSAKEEAGDWRLRRVERIFRLKRWGTMPDSEGLPVAIQRGMCILVGEGVESFDRAGKCLYIVAEVEWRMSRREEERSRRVRMRRQLRSRWNRGSVGSESERLEGAEESRTEGDGYRDSSIC